MKVETLVSATLGRGQHSMRGEADREKRLRPQHAANEECRSRLIETDEVVTRTPDTSSMRALGIRSSYKGRTVDA